MVASNHVADMTPMKRLPWQRPLPSNATLYILQLLASGGRTREPLLFKFGIQQQIRTAMTATLENIRNAITHLPMDRLERKFGGRIPS